jgi:hypothetical protein
MEKSSIAFATAYDTTGGMMLGLTVTHNMNKTVQSE